MIITKTPFRMSFFGGGTDMESFFREYGGAVLSTTFDKYCYVNVRHLPPFFSYATELSYAKTERVNSLEEIEHPAIRNAMKMLDMHHIRLTYEADLPARSGLGTSSSFAVGMLNAFYALKGQYASKEKLAKEAIYLERVLCAEAGGWQDQVGGLAPGIKMVTSDAAIVQEIGCSPCSISTETLQELNERFCLIYSGQRRLARNLLRDIVSRYVSGNPDTVEVLYEIQRIAVLMRFELEKGNVDGFAQLLNQHWELSRRLDGGCTNTCIDMIFSSVEDLIDGKMICGAGGGGFLQVILKKGVTVEQVQKRLREVFQDSGVEVWRCSLV